ncbi:MAG: hypothetical protein WBH76_03085, partial [Dictyoglomaceae bacterium]
HKTGVFICVEASEKDSFLNNAKSIIKNFFATIGASYKYELLCKGIDSKGIVRDHKDCIERAREIGHLIGI